ncbi:hypothetical protein FACUT_12015 [Fusarium acutatum]|uniref:Uncharacterized protein n=1 Tax=Fusarium acutatum TaxID=78861 RepID=A0A8H4JBW2_9HYPO|nr:hypothetical protein FACUT_12015 [Fusarium acutatum]
MSDPAHEAKQVSDRRRQQNVRAQKKYSQYFATTRPDYLEVTDCVGGRQKRHMECLEDLLFAQMESLDRLVEQNGSLDDDTRARIEPGHITLQDILEAALEALQLQQGKAHFEPTERSGEELLPGLRTDKILVTRVLWEYYRNLAAYHSLGKKLRDLLQDSILLPESIALSAVTTLKLVTRPDSLPVPNFEDAVQKLYEEVLISLLSDPLLLAVA